MDKNANKYLIIGLIFLFILGFICIFLGAEIESFFVELIGIALVGLSLYVVVNAIKAKIAQKKAETTADENSNATKSTKSSNKKLTYIIIAIVVLLAFILSGGFGSSGRSSSRKSSSNKPYYEQYGYDVEDFYYKGSDGLWYKK